MKVGVFPPKKCFRCTFFGTRTELWGPYAPRSLTFAFVRKSCIWTMSRSFSLHEEQSSLFSRESSLEPSFPGLVTSELRLLSHDEPRSEGYDEYFDPPLESKYECPICLLGLREPVQTSCGHRFCRGCIVRSIRYA